MFFVLSFYLVFCNHTFEECADSFSQTKLKTAYFNTAFTQAPYIPGQLALARTDSLHKLLCEHAQIEPSRAESSWTSSLSNSELYVARGLARASATHVAV